MAKTKPARTIAQKIDKTIKQGKADGLVDLQALDDNKTEYAMDCDRRIAGLDRDISKALSNLNTRQQSFCKYKTDGLSTCEALIKAGYTKSTAKKSSVQITANIGVRIALAALDRRNQLRHGISLDRKRDILLQLANTAADQNQKGYQPGSAVAAVRLLAELDSNIRVSGSGSGTVVVNVSSGIPQPLSGVTIEGQTT